MICAVIGIGSNSTRLLMGDVQNEGISILHRIREDTRLFAGLEKNLLGRESILNAAFAVSRLVAFSREHGAEGVHIIATSAARDAANSDELGHLILSMTGIEVDILSGSEEAELSFLGCAGTGYCGMIDLGGGSTEISIGGSNRPMVARSIQVGAGRLLREVPCLLDGGFSEVIDRCKNRARDGLMDVKLDRLPSAWYGIGGTLTCLASMDMELDQYDRESVDGYALTFEAVSKWAIRLSEMDMTERAQIRGIQPRRADIIAHGAAALLGVMDALGIPRLIVRNRSNLDGFLTRIATNPNIMEMSRDTTVDKVQSYYDASVEQEWMRLERGYFEFEINKRYMDRYIKPGFRVLDVGGGPGRYSLHLASRGASVTLFDLSNENILFAKKKAADSGLKIETVCGDARFLDDNVEGMFDAILLMGPLYHLTGEKDRVRAMQACIRKLKPGGYLFAAFISMIAGLIFAGRDMPDSILWEGEDVFYEKVIAREDFAGMAFTQAYFITPKNILPFMERFPLRLLHLVGSEGVCAPFRDRILEQSPEVRDKWLALSLALCEREEFFAMTEHFLYVGQKTEEEA